MYCRLIREVTSCRKTGRGGSTSQNDCCQGREYLASVHVLLMIIIIPEVTSYLNFNSPSCIAKINALFYTIHDAETQHIYQEFASLCCICILDLNLLVD